MKLILLPSILVLFGVLHHNLRKCDRASKHKLTDYRAREDAANATRRKDISNLPYLTVPLETFPFDITPNDQKKQLQIAEYRKEIEYLSTQKMLNLIGVSNTELKEQYGPANLEELSQYDQNYSRYIRTLQFFAECIYDEYPKQAVQLLEYCISIGTDISGTYNLLSQYYIEHHQQDRFLALYDKIPQKNSISGKTIQNILDNKKEALL